MLIDLRNYFLIFLVYALIGWIMETIYTLITDKKLTNRGFLIGTYCPIYGIGAVSVIILLSQYKSHPIVLFILAIVICSVLEYFTSYFMEKIFKVRWWDYSHNRFNINGRICLETMVPFGIGACFIIYIVNPFIFDVLNKFSSNSLNIISIVLGVLLIIDLIISFNIVNTFKKTVKNTTQEDKTSDINKYIKNVLYEKSFLHRRLIKAFPKIETKLKNIKHDMNIK